MAGGGNTTGETVESGGAPRSRGDQHERPLSGLVLVCCIAALVLTGVLLAAGPGGNGGLTDVRGSLEVVAGVLFFGAGLLQLAQWRVDRDATRGHTGLALLAMGFLTPRATALGPLLHDDPSAELLSPWTAMAVTLLALALGATGPGRLTRWAHSRLAAASGAGLLLGLLYLPLLLGRNLPFTLDVPRPVHLLVELGMATLFLALTRRLTRDPRAPLTRRPSLEAALVSLVGAVWLLRAAAVVAGSPWALAAAVLLALTAVLALVDSSTSFAASFDARERRVADAEASLAAASRILAELDGEGRSFRHDARNSMFALNAAAQVLAEHGPDLDQATRLRLRDAIRGEIGALEELLTRRGVTTGPTIPRQRWLGIIDQQESA